MHFNQKKNAFILTPLLLCSTLLSGCGLLGNIHKPNTGNGNVGQGCLNNSKDLVGRYTAGTISQAEWKQAFSCINDSLNFFTQYVRGSTQDAYTQGDMYTLISQFLLTNRPINRNLMRGAFNLKAALFGGDASSFKKEEVELLKSSLSRLSDITASLIPYLQKQNNSNLNYDDLNELMTAFKQAGDQLAEFINTLPAGSMSSDALKLLLKELGNTLEIPISNSLSDDIFLSKWFLFNTRKDSLEVADWAEVFRTAMGAGGIYIAFKAAVGNDINAPKHQVMHRLYTDYRFREFIQDLALQAKPYLDHMLKQHNGVIPFPLFDAFIEQLPSTLIKDIPTATLKSSLKPIFRKLLLAENKIGFDGAILNQLYQNLDTWVKTTGQLDRLYEKTGIDRVNASPEILKSAMTVYGASLSDPVDKTNFNLMKATLMRTDPNTKQDQFIYQPMLNGDENSIHYGSVLYQTGMPYSYYQGFTILSLNPLIQLALKAYGTGNGFFVKNDFVNIIQDYSDLLFAMKIVDQTLAHYGEKRFQDIDLFTPISNGDNQVSPEEVIHFAMMIMSSSKLSDRMRTEITPLCDAKIGTDILGWTYVNAACFRREFHERLTYWLNNFPRLKAYWSNLSAAEQKQAMIWLEHGSRRDGYNENDIGRFDFQAFATVLHYTESLFTRFDGNLNEQLDKNEISNAYPVFKSLLAAKAKISPDLDYVIKGIFTYIVKYRSMPVTNNLPDIAKLGWWIAIYELPTTHYSADRAGVFNIVCQLAAPETQSQIDKTPTICGQ